MSQRIFLFDVGNTNVKIGIADESAVRHLYVLPTDPACTADSIGLRLAEVARHAGLDPAAGQVEACVACSVVPAMDPLLRDACARFLGARALFAPNDVPVPLHNRYERPGEVGADRLVSAFAARALVDAPAHIVVDFGTATTFDCVRGEDYLGGLICPGVLSSARALAGQTAKLPQVSLELPEDQDGPAIGRSTSQSLNQGFVYGFAAMVDGLVDRLQPKVGGNAAVVATGGFAARIAAVCARLDHVFPGLLLEGLRLLYTRRS
jgi:type III pantothenate kinase